MDFFKELLQFLSLSDPNTRYVVLSMVLLSASAGAVGCFAFLRKRALVGDAIAHSVLPGVALAFMLTGTKNPVILLLGATTTGWLSLLAIDFITARTRLKADTAIGLVLSVFFGVGIMLLTSIQSSGNAAQSGLDKFLFGKAASMVGSDVWVFATLSLALIAIVILFFRSFTLVAFDRDFAMVSGLPVRTIELILATITVLAVATGIQAVGVVLMAALLISPAAAARFWTEKLVVMVIIAALFGAISGVVGSYISYIAPSMPTGPWVVVVLSLIAFFSLLFAPKRGWLARYRLQQNNQRKTLEENVLKTFFHIGEKTGSFSTPRFISELKDQRYLSTSTLTKALSRLSKKGFLHKVGKKSWQLTIEGKKEAQRIVRIHRLWEVYLSEYLRIAPDHVHNDAEAIEHIITPEIEAELEQLLNRPETDPHDTLIPYQ